MVSGWCYRGERGLAVTVAESGRGVVGWFVDWFVVMTTAHVTADGTVLVVRKRLNKIRTWKC